MYGQNKVSVKMAKLVQYIMSKHVKTCSNYHNNCGSLENNVFCMRSRSFNMKLHDESDVNIDIYLEICDQVAASRIIFSA